MRSKLARRQNTPICVPTPEECRITAGLEITAGRRAFSQGF